ncbi:MAG: glycosyltransferase family 4 protein [Gammaproteobacteria bacterium]|nr:glycosyltransferase family 1 protein [Gammaproteobacteria bacterium]
MIESNGRRAGQGDSAARVRDERPTLSEAGTRPIRALCITEDLDRPTSATFIGLARAGIDITVACPASATRKDELATAGVRVLVDATKEWLRPSGLRAFREELVNRRYDILHLFSNKALQWGLVASRGLPARIIAYRGIVGNVSFFNPIAWLRFLNPRIDRIVCVADAVRDYFLAMRPARWRIPEHKLVRIYKGHDPAWYEHEPADLASLGVPAGAFVVCCTANYRPRKGIEYLVDAVAALPQDVHLVLVGSMDDPRLSRRIERSGAAARIHRVGVRHDAPAIAAAADVFVLPSIKREGLARSLIEAMIMGTPPVVTNCGGSPELVVHEECGLVVPVRDSAALAAAVERLRRDADLRRRLGDAARRRILEHFRIDGTIAATLALYRELAGG